MRIFLVHELVQGDDPFFLWKRKGISRVGKRNFYAVSNRHQTKGLDGGLETCMVVPEGHHLSKQVLPFFWNTLSELAKGIGRKKE